MQWPKKIVREKFEIADFIDAYAHMPVLTSGCAKGTVAANDG